MQDCTITIYYYIVAFSFIISDVMSTNTTKLHNYETDIRALTAGISDLGQPQQTYLSTDPANEYYSQVSIIIWVIYMYILVTMWRHVTFIIIIGRRK